PLPRRTHDEGQREDGQGRGRGAERAASRLGELRGGEGGRPTAAGNPLRRGHARRWAAGTVLPAPRNGPNRRRRDRRRRQRRRRSPAAHGITTAGRGDPARPNPGGVMARKHGDDTMTEIRTTLIKYIVTDGVYPHEIEATSP